MKKLFLMLAVALALTANAGAAVVTYANQAAFLASVSDPKVDTFDGNFQILSNAAIKAASAGKVGYASSYFSNLNILSGGSLCWGCNGSGQMDLTDTNVGTINGVYGFSMTTQQNYGYNAYITFGDNSTMTLLNPNGYFGITSSSLIKHIEFAHSVGQTSWDGSIMFNDVTVAAAAESQVPEPGSLAMLGLGLLGLAGVRRIQARK